MIKIVAIRPVHARPELELNFSDGTMGLWSAAEIIGRDTVLARPLSEPVYFARCFIEGGALAWPNGLELHPPRSVQACKMRVPCGEKRLSRRLA